MSEEQIKNEMARLKKENPDLSDEQIAEKVAELALSGGEKAEKQAEKTPKQAEKTPKQAKKTEYVCHTRCVFDGVYYREGDILVTSAKDVPEYFTEKE